MPHLLDDSEGASLRHMGVETERKFLVTGNAWRSLADPVAYSQGYLSRGHGVTVRVRIAGNEAYLTVKGPVKGLSRAEFEYPIPVDDAREILPLSQGPLIEKTRRHITVGNHIWEVDEFLGANRGLVVAEIELSDPNEEISPPPWIGEEVTGDPRYYNSNLVHHPFTEWLKG